MTNLDDRARELEKNIFWKYEKLTNAILSAGFIHKDSIKICPECRGSKEIITTYRDGHLESIPCNCKNGWVVVE